MALNVFSSSIVRASHAEPQVISLMVKILLPVCFALVVLMLQSCASQTLSSKYQLKAVETEDDSKRFTYGFNIAGFGSSLGGEGPNPSANARARSANFEEMRKELETYMQVTGYCADGYFVYDETFNGREYLLYGECQESKAAN